MIKCIISRTSLIDANFVDARIVRNEEVLHKEDEDLLIVVLRNMVA